MVLRLSRSSYGKSHAMAYTWGRLQLLHLHWVWKNPAQRKGLAASAGKGGIRLWAPAPVTCCRPGGGSLDELLLKSV